MIRGIIVGHSEFAKAMVNTAEQIVGKQPDLEIISNKGVSCEVLSEKIAKIIHSNENQETIVFVDLPGGSCTISCYGLLKDNSELNIIVGVNLPMLIEFFMLRDKHSVNELVPILIDKGRNNIFKLRCKK
jgi:mannose/fructose-specific phosphotransferase system component IIA